MEKEKLKDILKNTIEDLINFGLHILVHLLVFIPFGVVIILFNLHPILGIVVGIIFLFIGCFVYNYFTYND